MQTSLGHHHQLVLSAIIGGILWIFGTVMVYNNGSMKATNFSIQSVSSTPSNGVCGAAHQNTLFTPVTLATPGLCKEWQESRLILQEKTTPFKATWECIGDLNMKSQSCEASLIVWKEPQKEISAEEKKSDSMLEAWKKMFGM